MQIKTGHLVKKDRISALSSECCTEAHEPKLTEVRLMWWKTIDMAVLGLAACHQRKGHRNIDAGTSR